MHEPAIIFIIAVPGCQMTEAMVQWRARCGPRSGRRLRRVEWSRETTGTPVTTHPAHRDHLSVTSDRHHHVLYLWWSDVMSLMWAPGTPWYPLVTPWWPPGDQAQHGAPGPGAGGAEQPGQPLPVGLPVPRGLGGLLAPPRLRSPAQCLPHIHRHEGKQCENVAQEDWVLG